MIDELKRIETMMQECLAVGLYIGHKRGDSLLDDLVATLSKRCYDDEKQTIEHIRSMYASARENWWYG